MRRSFNSFIVLFGTLLLAAGWPMAAHASPQMFVEYGCFNCHGNYQRGDAPNIEGLSKRLSRLKGDPTAEQKFVDKYRVGEAFERIEAHGRITPDTARTLIHWLAEGAKSTP
jgi:cytochrome c551/c552